MRRYASPIEAVRSIDEWVERCGSLLDALAEAVAIRRVDGELVFANAAMLELFGFKTLEDLRSHSGEWTFGGYRIRDEQGQPISIEEPLPPAEEVEAEPAAPKVVQAVDPVSGERRWWRFLSTPLLDTDDELIASVTVIEDLTALKAAESRTSMLAESGRLLVSSLDYEETLRNVAQIAIPELADWCAVDLIGDAGRPVRVATGPADGPLENFRSAGSDPDEALQNVIRSGTSVLYRRISADQLAGWATSDAKQRELQALEIRSVLIVPMQVPGRTIGAITFATTGPRMLGPEDQALAEQLGRRAGVAVENARLHSRLQVVAETLRLSLLPGELPTVPGWHIASLYQPARSELRIDIGGDFFELFQADHRWYALIGDVEGKGVTAATLTALMRNGAHFAAATETEPASLLERLDEGLRRHDREATCTALCAQLESDRLVLSSAGHPPALLVTEGGEVKELASPGPLLGAFDDARFAQQEVAVAVGDAVLFYTDGVIDAFGTGPLGRGRLRTLLAEQAGEHPTTILKHLEATILECRSDDAHPDDIAALALARS